MAPSLEDVLYKYYSEKVNAQKNEAIMQMKYKQAMKELEVGTIIIKLIYLFIYIYYSYL